MSLCEGVGDSPLAGSLPSGQQRQRRVVYLEMVVSDGDIATQRRELRKRNLRPCWPEVTILTFGWTSHRPSGNKPDGDGVSEESDATIL
jgi:hypothetical protein